MVVLCSHSQCCCTFIFCFPGGSDGEGSTCNARDHLQCGRLSFDPWVGRIPWRRKWQSTPVFLPREFHGQRSLAGCGPWVCKSQTQLSNYHPEMCSVLTYCGNWCIFLLVAAIGHILIVQSVLRYPMTLGINSECCLEKLILAFKQCLTFFFFFPIQTKCYTCLTT